MLAMYSRHRAVWVNVFTKFTTDRSWAIEWAISSSALFRAVSNQRTTKFSTIRALPFCDWIDRRCFGVDDEGERHFVEDVFVNFDDLVPILRRKTKLYWPALGKSAIDMDMLILFSIVYTRVLLLMREELFVYHLTLSFVCEQHSDRRSIFSFLFDQYTVSWPIRSTEILETLVRHFRRILAFDPTWSSG